LGPLGIPELLFILVLALLIFGPRKLPEIGRTLGKAMGEFRRATQELKQTLNTEAAMEESARRPARAPAPKAPAEVPPPAEAAAIAPAGEPADAAPAEGPPAEGQPPAGTESRS
jgi:TatA/E family protein of Tat protein translocase